MPSPRLTPAQVRVLRELCKPGAKAHHSHGANLYWFISGTLEHATRQIDALRKHGLLERCGGYFNCNLVATPAAHALLAEIDAQNA